MFKELKPGFMMMLVMTVLTGLIYPAVITGIAQVVFRDQANGSLIVSNGQVIGSRLIGQNFTKPEYFQPRPSAAGGGYDPTASAGSNLGPTSAKFINGTTKKDEKGNEVVDFLGIKARIVHYCLDNDIAYDSSVPLDTFKDAQGNLDDAKLIKAFSDEKAPLVFTPKTPIPADAVTASASGLDPHISPANAQAQAARVAKARGVSVEQVQALDRAAHRRTLARFPRRAARERPGAQSGAGPTASRASDRAVGDGIAMRRRPWRRPIGISSSAVTARSLAATDGAPASWVGARLDDRDDVPEDLKEAGRAVLGSAAPLGVSSCRDRCRCSPMQHAVHLTVDRCAAASARCRRIFAPCCGRPWTSCSGRPRRPMSR